jgi:hypothetical protein
MKAAIAIDKWKLPIFSRNLVAAGFNYSEAGAITDDALILHVELEQPQAQKLAQVVLASNTEAARSK